MRKKAQKDVEDVTAVLERFDGDDWWYSIVFVIINISSLLLIYFVSFFDLDNEHSLSRQVSQCSISRKARHTLSVKSNLIVSNSSWRLQWSRLQTLPPLTFFTLSNRRMASVPISMLMLIPSPEKDRGISREKRNPWSSRISEERKTLFRLTLPDFSSTATLPSILRSPMMKRYDRNIIPRAPSSSGRQQEPVGWSYLTIVSFHALSIFKTFLKTILSIFSYTTSPSRRGWHFSWSPTASFASSRRSDNCFGYRTGP